MSIFKLPDLGEGLQDAEIVQWHVKEGDTVKLDEVLVSMETAKAVVEVPSPIAGKIIKLHGKAGDTILTGAPLVEFASSTNAESAKNDQSTTHTTPASSSVEHDRKDAGTVAGKIEETDTILEEEVITLNKKVGSGGVIGVKVTPAVRALARKLNVDLNNITPTGPNNTITAKDVQDAKGSAKNSVKESFPVGDGFVPLRGVRKTMAQVMITSHKEVVPVTVCDDAKLLNWKDNEDITVRIIQAIAKGCITEPFVNSWFDGNALARKVMASVDLGLAMDTADGLFVPVIKDVANKSAKELRAVIDVLKVTVQNRTVPQDKLKGATITLSNFGKFAGRYANPIIVPPQVAILGVGVLRFEPVCINGEIKIVKVLPLALTIDHRALTGGEATRFLGTVIAELGK